MIFLDDDEHGQYFHSKYYPNLKFFVHTSSENHMGKCYFNIISMFNITNICYILGCLGYSTLYVTDPLLKDNLAERVPTLTDDTVAYIKATKGNQSIDSIMYIFSSLLSF